FGLTRSVQMSRRRWAEDCRASTPPSLGGPSLGDNLIGAPPGIGHDGECRVDARCCREGRTIDNVEILDLVSPAPFVKHRAYWVVAHARRAMLMRAVPRHSLRIHFPNGICAARLKNIGGAV